MEAVTVNVDSNDIEETVVYSRNPYTLTVDPNGGTWEGKEENSSITQLYGTIRNIELPVREDHLFVGWAKQNNPFYGQFEPNNQMSSDYTFGAGDDTIVAEWYKNIAKYTVNFYYEINGQYPENPDIVDNRKGTVGQDAEATEQDVVPVRQGYVFDEDANNILTAKIKQDDTTHLDIYFKQQFTVEFRPGENSEFIPEIHEEIDYGEPTPEEPDKVCKIGYKLEGWTPQLEDIVTRNMIYISNCVPDEVNYAIEFYYQQDGKYLEYDNREIRKGLTESEAQVTAEDLQPKKEKYVLDSTYNESLYKATIKPDGSTVLKVHFKRQYTVIYKAGEHGDFEPQITEKIEYGTKTPVAPKTPAKQGYKFSKWDKTIEDIVTHDEIYTALYEPIKYKIIYKPNGGKGTMDPQIATYDVKDNFKKNEFTRDTCKFIEWNSNDNGKGISFKENQEFLNLTNEEDKEIYMYAI